MHARCANCSTIRLASARADPGASKRLVLEARIVARAGDHRALEAEALYQLALLAHHGAESEDAFALASEAVALATDDQLTPNEFSVTLAWSLHLLAVIHYQAEQLRVGARSRAAWRCRCIGRPITPATRRASCTRSPPCTSRWATTTVPS